MYRPWLRNKVYLFRKGYLRLISAQHSVRLSTVRHREA